MKRPIAGILGLCYFHCGFCQMEEKQPSTFVFGINTQYGFIIPHSAELKAISQSNPWGLSADASKLFDSDKTWENCQCYAKIGVSFNYYNYGNPEQLGNSYNLIMFAEPYLGFRRKLHTTLRAGMGITYLNQVYNEVTNPENLFYSSPLSFIMAVQLKFNYRINPYYTANLSLNYNHISNAAISQPNKGMNYPMVGLGLEYTIRPVSLEKKPALSDFDKDRWIRYARLFWNVRTVPETDEYDETNDIMIGLEAGLMKPLSRINGLMGGGEFSYDGSFKQQIDRSDLNYSPYLASVHLGHFFAFGKFTFTQQFAAYVFKSYPFNDKSFFQRYAILWQFGKLINCGFSLKSHGHVAEYMDVRMGVMF